ncbi:MAG: sporulation protein YabP [Clostridia bacterium]|nr:sporulation protein YabP [Clostridia bacterium]
MDEKENYHHGIISENRKTLNLSGIKDVLSFDEETLLLDTVMGRMTVRGENLHIKDFQTETGEFVAEGRIHAIIYLSDAKTGGFFSKLLR